MRCPKCRSTNVSVLGQHKKSFSVGKAAAGTALTGGIGVLAGFAGKKTKKVDMICMDCGHQFRYKK
ncbi:LITAF-like zinc ribbon domain-containing protein [Lactobacillus sp. ESL0680]|uniref:LITAF-like zinc ribbon domain-containing protein n=1 Tax=Lactobacillus sp. ESL0680 TaxID=2983210 RepID=UPI0023F62895|nr:LITAF-like zinc ribbon domain-containing protein [Lactobacillus sp. ESL0680]WEV39464.1 LITAF-like zinc ribbon domain-containing protein [Lactobacillus sp. ESL0680]